MALMYNKGMFWTKIHSGHLLTVIAVAVVSIYLTLLRSVPALPESNENLTIQLGEALDLSIRCKEIHWIEGTKPTGLKAALVWSEVVFIAATDEELPADLYRAEVRLADDGSIMSVKGVKNLTDTPAGDEYALAVAPPQAAVATRALGQVRAVTVFDFSGQEPHQGEEWTTVTRFLARLTDLRKTGRYQGVKKTTLRFEKPPEVAELSIENIDGQDLIVVNQRSEDAQSVAVIDKDGFPAKEANLVATQEMRLAKRPILWLVDTVRSFSWVGPGPIEWAEGRFFALRDAIKRTKYELVGEEEFADAQGEAGADDPVVQEFHVPGGLEVGQTPLKVVWPPPTIKPPVFKRVAVGEGIWRPSAPDFVKQLPGAPPVAYTAFTRPDIRRPYVRVHMIALDMRQLNLHMVGGYEDPKPTTGSQGTGRIPRKQEVLDNVVAAFNGAFKTLHGAYGMMVDRDVLLPPQKDAATVASMKDGRVLLGTWPAGAGIPKGMSSYRQNMVPVVEDGVVNPTRRYLWGFTLDEDITNMNTIRSGICMTAHGSLLYAWGEDLTATTLGTAMNAAGCTYGIHLDMNPFHTSFIYYRFGEMLPGKRPEFEAKLVYSEMRFSPNRYVNGAPKDFFYATLKDTAPGPGWQSEGLTQPQPGFVPAVHKFEAEGCDLVAVDMSRTRVTIEPGAIPSHLVPGSELAQDDDISLLLVDLPIGRWSLNRGQVVNGAVVADFTDARATLAVDEMGKPILGVWPVVDGKGATVGNAVQTEWLASAPDGLEKVTAAGVLKGRWFVVGEGNKVCLQEKFEELGLSEVVFFENTGGSSSTAIRSEDGLVDLEGNRVKTRDASTASIRILANPRNLGASKLEALFPKPSPVEAQSEKGKNE